VTAIVRRLLLPILLVLPMLAQAAGGEKPRDIDYPLYPPAPRTQTADMAMQKTSGCQSCHTTSDAKTMHANPGVVLGCTDCHGGDATVFLPDDVDNEAVRLQIFISKLSDGEHAEDDHGESHDDGHADEHADDHGPSRHYSEAYQGIIDQAHVQPLYPETWHYPASATPKRTYALLNKESPEYVRFVNPSDYRVARESCGACHLEQIQAAERSIMATATMFWGGAAYNNGILPFKQYILGESYTRDGEAAGLKGPPLPEGQASDYYLKYGIVEAIAPLPSWETIKPGDIFRVFERGGRNIINLFPETGLPNALGQLQRLEEPGRPDLKQSNRGPGTGGRISVPVLNMHKTRLNDPLMWFSGTNDNPGDFRASGCGSCHIPYANDRDPLHSSVYAKFGHWGESQQADPTIPRGESGHPIKHQFTRAIPSSQCMVCHMHQPNMFMNTYLGYTMWDYESDAPSMWPEEQKYPTDEEMHDALEANPEGAVIRGKWSDPDFLSDVSKLNPGLKDTQFADYHGHGWNFRAIFKRDRVGNLLDENDKVVPDTAPDKFKRAVHMRSIHAEKGMQCGDCHFAQDAHGNGHIYGEVAAAVEIRCKDCHGSADAYPSLRTSGPAAPPEGHNLAALRNPDGRKRFEWIGNKLIQRSISNPDLQWEMSLVKDTVTKGHRNYNAKSARAKLMSTNTAKQNWGKNVSPNQRAHKDEEMECYTCHTSWTTSCGGCHLPIEANRKTDRHHYEGGETRNYATYNPQVARDQMFLLGKHGPIKGGTVAPIRSTSALVLSSTNANREKIYVQQPPVSASGYSSQAFNPHFPHTSRKSETKQCEDCHLSKSGDNNSIMAQLLMFGTNYINFIGYHAYIGLEGGTEAVQVTEWDEPQTVIGSYLQKYAYPDWYAEHNDNAQELKTSHGHSTGEIGCLQLRGEYLYAAAGKQGMRVLDVASIANKGFSQRIVSAPFSALGQDSRLDSKFATCLALPSNQPIHPDRNEGKLMRELNLEQPFHPIYDYAFITDRVEGLIVTDINTFSDGEFRNNDLERALTWNGERHNQGILDGASHITIGGHYFYIIADAGLVILDMNSPLHPKVLATLPLNGGHSSALQFRYLWVTDADGLKVVDVTDPAKPQLINNNTIALDEAHRVYLARTYAYVAAGKDGLAIVDITKPTKMKLYQMFDADGQINDARDVKIGSTNASLFAYIADGKNGLKVLQMTSPDSQPKFYGYSPAPKPELIAWKRTSSPALAVSEGLHRDRGVDETGHQIAVFGRIGSRPFNLQEMREFYLDDNGKPWTVRNK